ncbi:MAG TPA: 3-hydroxyacyl-ACP dehydratase FabZ [Fimbriimonadaceae bacterium]|nr:3-hydroxyacyl-ACP dehydratase FabZ [Fimbriimonadaceae bacterium]
MIKIDEIMKVLPHRYPMLLIDRILVAEPGKAIRAVKNVTINEAFFQGHYPGMPVMPGVLILESMAQAGAALMLTDPNMQGRMPLVGAFDNVRFKRPVVPGDQLITDVEVVWFRGDYGKIRATASVDGEVAASMEAAFKLVSGS